MEQWVRWRSYRHRGIGKTMLQRCMDGMPGTNCPTCAGHGRAPGAIIGHKASWISCPTCSGTGRAKLHINHHRVRNRRCPVCMDKQGNSHGEVNGHTCFRCRGSGRLEEVFDKANPAFIHSTYLEPDNPSLQRVDRLVCELRRRDVLKGYWYVVHAEYCDHRGGTQEIKAGRLGISHGSYRKRLQRALEWIDACLQDRRQDCRQIAFPYTQPENGACILVTK
jgi:hypothetical protein